MILNRIPVVFGGSRIVNAPPINYQHDIKQKLVIKGLELPQYFTADFCNEGDTSTKPMSGSGNEVEIPDEYLQTGKKVKAYIILTGTDDGASETRYEITIPVRKRPTRTDITPTPAQQLVIDTLIDDLNDAVEQAEGAAQFAEDSEAWAVGERNGTPVTSGDETYQNNAKFYAELAMQGAGHYPIISSGYWYVWDAGSGGYVNTNVKAEGDDGQDGVSPAVTIAAISGGHSVTITDADHPSGQTFDVMDGEDGGVTTDIKNALLQLAQKVAYIDSGGQTYYQDLFDALYPGATLYAVTNNLTNCSTSNSDSTAISGNAYSATITADSGYSLEGATVSITMDGTDITSTAYSNGVISIASVSGDISITISAVEYGLQSITATFTQGQNVYYDFDYLNDLKANLVVTANYGGSQTEIVPASDYTLSGTLVAGTSSTITVTYEGKTDTFTVAVTALPSLPSGYTAYDYVLNNKVGSTGTTNNGICVDTGLNAQTYAGSTYSRRVDFKNNGTTSSTTASALYGCRNGTGATNIPNSCVMFLKKNSDSQGDMNVYCQLNNAETQIGYFAYNALQVIETKGTSIYKNGVLITDSAGDPTQYTPANLNIALFGEYRDNFYAVKSSIKLYRFIVRNSNGEAVAAMLPCTDSNSSPGLYDVVRNVFKQANTASYLTAGNDS